MLAQQGYSGIPKVEDDAFGGGGGDDEEESKHEEGGSEVMQLWNKEEDG